MELSEHRIMTGSGLVHYYSTPGAGVPVVFLHGWRSDAKAWFGLRKLLSPGNFYLLDLPGFGGSERPARPFSVDDYCDIVEDLAEKLDLKDPIFVGHSFGGRIAIKLAARGSAARVILIDSGGIREITLTMRAKSLIAKILKPLFSIPGLSDLRLKIYALMGADDYIATPELRETFLRVIAEDLRPSFGSIKVPTLVLWGDKDQTTPLRHGLLMHEAIAGSEFHIVPGGHFSFIDSPELVSRYISAFIK